MEKPLKLCKSMLLEEVVSPWELINILTDCFLIQSEDIKMSYLTPLMRDKPNVFLI
jgi:hypothetical protein